MDIDILLFLQNLRSMTGDRFSEFLSKMSFFGEPNTILIISAVIYWSISKKFGTYFLMGWSGNRIINGALKVSIHTERPWIRDTRIVPYKKAINSATGYSFPSGHAMNASSLYGGGAVCKEFPKSLRRILCLLVFLIAFSRCYLGVHTPQDVIIGSLIGMAILYLSGKIIVYIDRHPGKAVWVAICGCLLSVAVALYTHHMIFHIGGNKEEQLLADVQKTANDAYYCVGWSAAFFIGWILEKKYINFSTDVSFYQKLIRMILGLLFYYMVTLILIPMINERFSKPTSILVSSFIQMFYIVFIFPCCLSFVEKRTVKNA